MLEDLEQELIRQALERSGGRLKEAAELLGLRDVEFAYTGGTRGWKGDVPVIRFNTDKLRSAGWKNRCTSRQALEKSMSSILDDARNGRFDAPAADGNRRSSP